jgi:hypothetical protein
VDLVRAGTGAVNRPAVDGTLFAGLCDDAALFPPGNAPVTQAVPAHRRHRAAWYRELVGPFLATPQHLPGVAEAAREDAADPDGAAEPLGLVLVGPRGPAALGPAVRAATGEPGIELVGVELACGAQGTSAEAAREAADALGAALPRGVGGVIEVRRGEGLADALDLLASTPFRAKFRTGGAVAGAFPTESELAGFLLGCVTRALPFKCTAGLHEAARHADPVTGFEHHGFLNILLATHVAGAGGDVGDVVGALSIRSARELADALRPLTPEEAARARSAFTAYGTCSIGEPLADLTALGLVRVPAELPEPA